MKTSWSLSCFGIIGKRGKKIKGNIKASITKDEKKKKKNDRKLRDRTKRIFKRRSKG